MVSPVNVTFVNAKLFMGDLTTFANKNVPEKFDAIMIKVVSDLVTSVVFLTPVDTGRLRGGWQVGVGSMDLSSEMPPDPGGNQTVKRAQDAIRAAASGGKTLMGKIVYVYNNVFYVEYIEYGTDKMAPFGMLRESIAIVQGSFA